MSVSPLPTGSITPIIPGSITPIRDTGRSRWLAAELVVSAIQPLTRRFLSCRVGGKRNAEFDREIGAEANADLGVHG